MWARSISAGGPAVDQQPVAAGGPVVRHGLVDVRPADPERVLDPGHGPGAPLTERPEPFAQPVELLVGAGLEADVVGHLAVGQRGAPERQRAGRAGHVHVVVLLGQQDPAAAVGEPQRPRVRGDHRDQVTGGHPDLTRGLFARADRAAGPGRVPDQRQHRLRPRPLGPVPAQADPDDPRRHRRHLDGQRLTVAGRAGEGGLPGPGRGHPGRGQRGRGTGRSAGAERQVADLLLAADQ